MKRILSLLTLFVIAAPVGLGVSQPASAQVPFQPQPNGISRTMLPDYTSDSAGRLDGPAQGMPSWPDPIQPIARHEPGRLANANNNQTAQIGMGPNASMQVRNLDALLADGSLEDPLQGNYRLVNWDQILVARTDEFMQLYQETNQGAFPDPADERVLLLDDPQMISDSELLLGTTNVFDRFDVASGDLNADGQAEQITAWADSATGETVHLTVGELPGSVGRFTSDPAALGRSEGKLDLFARGYDDGLWYRHYDGASWTDWQGLGGTLTSAPAVASWSEDRLDVFALGTDAQVYNKTWTGSDWSDWGAVPVAPPVGVQFVSRPAAVSRGPNQLDLFVRASDNRLWYLPYDGGWGSWQSLDGIIVSSPAVTASDSGRLEVFGRGVDSALWYRTFDGTWSAWQRLAAPAGLGLNSDPSVVSSGPGMLEVFARATDDALWQASYASGTWSSWTSRGGELGSGPGAAIQSGGDIHVYAQTTEGTLMVTTSSGGGWSTWADLNGLPPCCVDYDTGRELGNSRRVKIKTGYFLGDQRDQLVVAFGTTDERVELVTYRFEGGFRPTAMGVVSTTATIGGSYRSFDLTTGDLDGDGLDEIGLNMTIGQNSYLIQVFDVDSNGAPVARGFYEKVDPLLQFNHVGIVAGDYMGDGKDKLVRSYSRYKDSDGTYSVFVGRVSLSDDLMDVGLTGGELRIRK